MILQRSRGGRLRVRSSMATLGLMAGTLLSGGAFAAEADADSNAVDGVVVTAEKTTSAGRTITRLPLTLRETPQSVTVIDRQQMDDFNLVNIAQVLEQTPGITVQELDSNRVGFSSRGFSIANFQVDGVPTTYASGNSVLADTGMFQQIEVVRGATGLVTGAGDPSATVNLVRKRPTKDFQAAIGGTVGSWNLRRLDIDVSGPLLLEGRIRGRLVGSTQKKESYMDFYKEDRQSLYGVLEADITADTVLRVGADYQDTDPRGSSWGTVPLYYRDGTLANLPRSFSLASKWSTWSRDTTNVFANLEHAFGDSGWLVRASVNHRKTNVVFMPFYGGSGYPNRDGSGMGVWDSYGVSEEKELGYDLYVSGPLTLFGRKHELVFGTNGYDREMTSMNSGIVSRPYATTIPNIFTWTGDTPPPVTYNLGTPSSITHTKETGYYGALRLNPIDPLKVIIGARSTKWETYTTNHDLAGAYLRTSNRYSDNRLTPYVGVVYDITPTFSAYVSYSDLFKPQSVRDRNDTQLNPVVGSNFEGGLKADFLDGRLYAAVSAYLVKQDNLAEIDPTVPDGFLLPDGSSAYRAVNGAKTKGADFEVSGLITDRWRVNGGYTWSYTENAAGLRINTINPRHIARLYTTYRFDGAFQGLTVGGGLSWQSEIFTLATIPTSATTTARLNVKQDSYVLASLMARYDITEKLTLGVNVDNLFDETYYRRVGFYNGGYYGEPRKVTVSLRASF